MKKELDDNHRLMRRLSLSATPAIYFRDESGAVKLQMGLPTTAQLETVLDTKDKGRDGINNIQNVPLSQELHLLFICDKPSNLI